jgi:hypothetical protein
MSLPHYKKINQDGPPGPPGGPPGFIVTFILNDDIVLFGQRHHRAISKFITAESRDKVLKFLDSKRKGTSLLPILEPGEWEAAQAEDFRIHDRKKLVLDIIKEYGRIIVRGRKNAKKII